MTERLGERVSATDKTGRIGVLVAWRLEQTYQLGGEKESLECAARRGKFTCLSESPMPFASSAFLLIVMYLKGSR